MEKAIVHWITYDDDISPDIAEKQAEMKAIRTAINQLSDSQEAEVLRCRYIDGDGYDPTKWRDVALKMYRDDDESKIKAAQRVHDRAIINIGKVKT